MAPCLRRDLLCSALCGMASLRPRAAGAVTSVLERCTSEVSINGAYLQGCMMDAVRVFSWPECCKVDLDARDVRAQKSERAWVVIVNLDDLGASQDRTLREPAKSSCS